MSRSALATLKSLGGYRFRVEFDEESMPSLIVDEKKPTGNSAGPNPSRPLSAAIGHCLSSSLLYCLHRTRIEPKNIAIQFLHLMLAVAKIPSCSGQI